MICNIFNILAITNYEYDNYYTNTAQIGSIGMICSYL
jgi:hypothetical protein